MTHGPRLGISGVLTRAFIQSPLTPLILLAGLALGLIALIGAAARGGAADLGAHGRHLRPRRRPQGRGRGQARHRAPGNHRQGHQRGRARLLEHGRRPRRRHGALLRRHPADDAILRVHEKVRANYDRIPTRHSRAADRRARHRRRGHRDADAGAEARRRSLSGQRALSHGREPAGGARQARRRRARPTSSADGPIKSASSRIPSAFRSTASRSLSSSSKVQRGQPLVPRWPRARAQPEPRRRRRPDAAGHSRRRAPAAHRARRPPRLRARRRQRHRRRQAARAAGVALHQDGGRQRFDARAGRHDRARQARGRQRRRHLRAASSSGWPSSRERWCPRTSR